MANCCGCNKRVISNLIANSEYNNCDGSCTDVCTTPQCGDPKYLTVLAPVVYDEIGINVCRSIDISTILTANPTAVYATVEVFSIAPPADATFYTITPISGRQNCYEVTLNNLVVSFILRLYDCCKRVIATDTIEGTYLPPTTDPSSDPETNPQSVTLEIFAPYGVAYTTGDTSAPGLNVISFSTETNSLTQGLNLTALPKVLNLDTTAGTITIGLTIIVNSIYFSQYQLPHMGKAIIPKGRLSSTGDSVCFDFVCGNLLDRSIKPLEFFNPLDRKENCNTLNPDCDCQTNDSTPQVLP